MDPTPEPRTRIDEEMELLQKQDWALAIDGWNTLVDAFFEMYDEHHAGVLAKRKAKQCMLTIGAFGPDGASEFDADAWFTAYDTKKAGSVTNEAMKAFYMDNLLVPENAQLM